MNVIISENLETSCRLGAEAVIEVIRKRANVRLGLATGSSPEYLYKELVRVYREGEVSFKGVSTINLDEYRGLEADNPASYAYYMRHHLFDHVDFENGQINLPSGVADEERECQRLDALLEEQRQDIQILGIGSTGHIGFNEPARELHAGYSIVDLSKETIKDNSRFFTNKEEVPKKAITMGIGGILKAQKIILIASGEKKRKPIEEILGHDRITTSVPCTFLKLHPDVTLLVDSTIIPNQ